MAKEDKLTKKDPKDILGQLSAEVIILKAELRKVYEVLREVCAMSGNNKALIRQGLEPLSPDFKGKHGGRTSN